MRTPRVPLLLVLLLPACAASTSGGRGDAELAWRHVQRERLTRLYERRPEPGALTVPAVQDPKPANARRDPPRHIDQREPPRAGTGPRPYHVAPGPTVGLAVGQGTLAVKVPGTLLDDRTDALFVRLTVDAPQGAGLHLYAGSSDDDLFEDRRINDGVAPADADARATGFGAFPHLRLDPALDGELTVPIRVGLFADWLQVDHSTAGVEREWASLGPRVVVEPRWRLAGGDGSQLSLVGRFGADVGPAWFAEQFRGGADEDTTIRWSGALGLGLRGDFGRTRAELGYEAAWTWYGSIDSELFGDRSRTEVQQQQWFLGFSTRF